MKYYFTSLLLLAVASLPCLAQGESEGSPIYDSAPGTEKYYNTRFSIASMFSSMNNMQEIDEVCYRISYDGDNAYIYNLLSVGDFLEKYVKCDVVDNQIIIPTGFIYKDQGYAQGIVRRVVKNDEGKWSFDYDNNPVVWTIESDGTIKDTNPDEAIGLELLYPEDDYAFEKTIMDNFILNPWTFDANEPPAGAEVMEFRREVEYEVDMTTRNEVMKVAKDGDTYYFQGLVDDESFITNPRWITGTLEDNVITIPAGQLLGVDLRGYFNYFYTTTLNMETGQFTIEDTPAVFKISDDGKTMTTEDWLISTQGFSYVCLYFPAPKLTFFDPVPATPETPVFVSFDDSWYNYFGSVTFIALLPYFDTEGEFIDPARMTYSIFLDNDTEPYVFLPEDYMGLMTPMSEFPYSYESFFIKNSSSENYQRHIIDVATNDFTKIGIQTYYTVGDERGASEILWYDKKTTAAEALTVNPIASEEYYDLTGVKVSPSAKGIVIRRITYADGSVKTVKESRR